MQSHTVVIIIWLRKRLCNHKIFTLKEVDVTSNIKHGNKHIQNFVFSFQTKGKENTSL